VTLTSIVLGEAKLESVSNHEVLLVSALVQTCCQCTYLCIQAVWRFCTLVVVVVVVVVNYMRMPVSYTSKGNSW